MGYNLSILNCLYELSAKHELFLCHEVGFILTFGMWLITHLLVM